MQNLKVGLVGHKFILLHNTPPKEARERHSANDSKRSSPDEELELPRKDGAAHGASKRGRVRERGVAQPRS